MKRSTPLRRTGGLKRGTRLSARSKRREEEHAERYIVRQHVFARDHWRCQMPTVLVDHGEPRDAAGSCMGELTPHHLHKASAGGAYTADNLLTLCAVHNEWVEDHPLHAAELGLVRRG